MHHILPSHQAQFVLWEEVFAQIFKPRRGHGFRNLLVPRPSLWRYQVGVRIANQQQRAPPGTLAYGPDDVLYCQGVIWGQVSPHNVPTLSAS